MKLDEVDIDFIKSNGIETPSFFLDLQVITYNIENLSKIVSEYFSDFEIAYSIKTNGLKPVVITTKISGCGCSVSSYYELNKSLQLKYAPNKLYYSGHNKRLESIGKESLKGLNLIIESIDEVNFICSNPSLFSKSFILLRLAHRIKKGYSRFGLDPLEAIVAQEQLCNAGCAIHGFHIHAGSNLADSSNTISTICENITLIRTIIMNTPDKLIVNIGGGMKAKKGISDTSHWSAYLRSIRAALDQLEFPINKTKMVIEPGRALVEDAMLILGRILTVKQREQTVLISDAGTNILRSNPIDAEKIKFFSPNKKNQIYNYQLTGQMCYESDYLTQEFQSSTKVTSGDYFAIKNVGAYNTSTTFPWIMGSVPVYLVNQPKASIDKFTLELSESELITNE